MRVGDAWFCGGRSVPRLGEGTPDVHVLSRGGAFGTGAVVLCVAPLRRSDTVNTFQEAWKKEAIGTGLFVENYEEKSSNFLKKVEEKKLLSFVEKAGLLSTAEKAGLSLSKVEQLKLLSTAESLGLLSLAESAATTDGAVIASLGLPFFALGCAALLFIPDQNLFLTVTQDVLAATLFGGAFALLVVGNLVNALNE